MVQPNPTQSNPWLQLAMEAHELIKKEPPFVQESLRRMNRTHISRNRQSPTQAGGTAAMTEPQLTPAQQNLMSFLDKLASSPYSPGLMQEGNQVLDAAVKENQRLLDSIHSTSNAMRSVRQCAELEGGISDE
jgi:hypothetical protein